MGVLPELVVDKLRAEKHTLEKSGKSFIVDGVLVKQGELVDRVLFPFATKHGLATEIFNIATEKALHPAVNNEIADILSRVIAEKEKASRPQPVLLKVPDISCANISPFIEFRSGKLILFDSKEGVISEMHPDIYMRLMAIPTTRGQKQDIYLIDYPVCISEVNPFTTESLYEAKIGGSKMAVINEYRHPSWMKRKLTAHEISDLTIPEDIDTFLSHLCENQESKEAVLDWVGRAVWGKADTHLCLNGDKKIGKSFFCKIFHCLVGDSYVNDASKATSRKEFNIVFKKSRILLFEEQSVTKNSGNSDDSPHEFFKRVANETISIEGKGTNAETIRNITSCIIPNNNLGSLQIDSNDRRFLVPELAKTDPNDVGLEDLMDRIRDDYITKETRDEDKIAQLGFALKNYRKKKFERDVYKGERFRKAVRANLTDWQEFLVQKIEEKSRIEYSLQKARKQFHDLMESEGSRGSLFPRKLEKIQALFDNYLDAENGVKLATVKKVGMDVVIEPLGKYKPSLEEDYVQTDME